MIPENRFSITPISGDLLNPISLNRLIGKCYGPVAIQDPSQGLLVKVWTAYVEDHSVYLLSDTTLPVLLFTRPGDIKNLSVAFDQNGNPSIAFQEGTQCYLYWFDPVPNAYVFFHLPDGATTPYITLDDARPFYGTFSDMILGYCYDNALRFRQQRDRFTIEYTPTVGDPGPTVEATVLYYVGMNSHLRLEWIYAAPTPIFDVPDIMKKQILVQKAPAEQLELEFDFYHTMLFGDTIEESAVTITVNSGTDPNPTAMLVGSSTHTDRTVIQMVDGGISGNIYLVSMSARTASNCVYVVEGLLAVNDSPAIIPPDL